MSRPIRVAAVGLAATGLAGWEVAQPVLRGESAYVAAALPPFQPRLLPANERRRAKPAVLQAFRAAEDAVARASCPAADLATVFASSEADMEIIHRICTALGEPARIISPTDFHNSVHNAAAGYWSIAVGARGPSNTICAYDASFAAGLLDAAAQVGAEACDTLLVAYDVPTAYPLNTERPIPTAASVALVLSAGGSGAQLLLSLQNHGSADTLSDPGLEALRQSNPAARALPLLRLLATGASGSVLLDCGGGKMLRVEVTAA
jgi:hypothetical protein